MILIFKFMNITEHKKDFVAVIEFLKNDLTGLRTGRASSAMVESVLVEAYGSKQPLKAVASIMVADAKTLALEPWDKSLLGAVDKGVRDSGLGVNPINDGKVIRITLPDLTSERRAELIKILHQKLEQARVSLRKVREEVREKITEQEKQKMMSEDEKFKLFEDLEKLVKEFNEEVKLIGENKEVEINKV
jgi:ribosome recycling factor